MIRIDAIRELRRDLHMRPFEADRRVYLIFSAHLMNEDAADALLKDLEEPPPYAMIVLVADDLGPIPETIRSRCQLVPSGASRSGRSASVVDARAPELDEDAARGARAGGGRPARPRSSGCSTRTRRARREALLAQARAAYARRGVRARRCGARRSLEARGSAGRRRRSSRR